MEKHIEIESETYELPEVGAPAFAGGPAAFRSVLPKSATSRWPYKARYVKLKATMAEKSKSPLTPVAVLFGFITTKAILKEESFAGRTFTYRNTFGTVGTFDIVEYLPWEDGEKQRRFFPERWHLIKGKGVPNPWDKYISAVAIASHAAGARRHVQDAGLTVVWRLQNKMPIGSPSVIYLCSKIASLLDLPLSFCRRRRKPAALYNLGLCCCALGSLIGLPISRSSGQR
jgi:hypothetical protein